MSTPVDPTAKACICSLCDASFSSKTKLFKHLEQHGFEGPNTKPEKVVLLLGWLAEPVPDCDLWQENFLMGREEQVDEAEKHLLRAIYALEQGLNVSQVSQIPPGVIERARGTSRASRALQRASPVLGLEESCHGQCGESAHPTIPPY
jgi:hypothetical protein